MQDRASLVADLKSRASNTPRFMIAVAGAPGSGKSTFAAHLVQALKAAGETAIVVPMDGFHFDDCVLTARGDQSRKGAPWTFDVAGLFTLLTRIKACEPDIAIPVFDRHLELSRNAADIVNGTDKFIIVEGNYLLLDEMPWNKLKALFDVTLFLDVTIETIEHRLLSRIKQHGHDEAYARNWMQSNDLPNARTVIEKSVRADMIVSNG
jgi:pantothenate kinase